MKEPCFGEGFYHLHGHRPLIVRGIRVRFNQRSQGAGFREQIDGFGHV